ncbi:MAG TPA: hypothetical protein VE967_18550 [Gemmatimonadaceae bacterium]|nr:hypothetical protein [Gemmatimonadaceae bacterium]
MRAALLSFAIGVFALHTTAVRAQSWTLAANASVIIGSEDRGPEYQLSQVSLVRRLSDGRILVVMGPDMRYFDASGKYTAKAGGRGQGPGEFQYVSALYVLAGDTLLAQNSRAKVWLSRDGKFIRQEILTLDPLMKNGWFAEGAMLLPNGNLLSPQYQEERPGSIPTGLYRPVLRYTLLDVSKGTIIPLITSGGLRQITHPGGRGGGVQPFTPHAQQAIGADRLYVGDNDTTFVSVFTLDGKPLGTVTVADKAVPVTARDLDDYKKSTLESIGNNAERRARFEQSWNEVPKPARFPYWSTAMVDKTGNLWVSMRATPALPTEWRVFDRAGKRIATLTAPAHFSIREIGADYVLGVAVDDAGIESVRMYALVKR